MQLIYLIGMPACGKSTLGLKLSESLKYSFVDLDSKIEEIENQKISEIFKIKGEEYFRLIESKTLKNTLPKIDTIISTGGGAPCFYDNIDFMNKKGITIFIDTPLDMLYQRASKSSQRPLLEGKSGTQLYNEINMKYKQRLPFYTKAKIHLTGNDISVQKISESLLIYSNKSNR